MALIDFKVLPGIDKQDTTSGAENRWVDCDNTRFRYGLPEKVGGWSSLITDTIVGVARREFAFVDLDGNRYVAIGTDKFLLIYFEGQLYDITPLKTTLTSATLATTDTSAICSITTGTNHDLSVGDIVLLDTVTLPVGTGYVDADFENKLFQVTSITSATVFTITQSTAATATVGTGGSLSVKPYEQVGPAEQSYGYGWGIDTWSSGKWGEAASASDVSLEPGLWSLSNFGQVLVATIANSKTFTWNAGDAARLITRASTTTSGFETTNNPTATRVSLISPTTRHLIHLGTETTIGDPTTQDDMFIRFSDQEDINDYVPTAINSAGSQRLQDGTRIIGALKAKESILVWTDNALYTMKFIGAPFTFGFEQVGTNCGLIGKNAAIEIDGVAFWMSSNGFFMFDGTVKSLPCSVEDYVYDQADTTKGQQVYAGINNLFTEVVWYYPSTSSEYNDQYVVFNYGQAMKGGVWYIGTEARTSWIDATVYQKPIATKFDSTTTGTFPVIIGESGLGQTTLFEHEVGTDQVNPDGSTTTVTSFIKSFDFDLQARQQGPDGKASGPSISGDVFLAMRRFVPDFKDLQGNATVTLAVKRYPQQSDTVTSLSPFTINANTDKKDTRARGRFVNIKIENTDVSESWRFGTLRIDIQPDGKR
ncbi:hypothetical protein N9W29_00350 [Candidatus Pelagibacter bacterium]|nr:hypothetical protein [Candidatus Pelagibacter bacterium]